MAAAALRFLDPRTVISCRWETGVTAIIRLWLKIARNARTVQGRRGTLFDSTHVCIHIVR